MNEAKAKQQRLLAVRKQESLIAREASKSFKAAQVVESKVQNLSQIKSEKLAEYEALVKQKDYCLENLGKAQQEAEREIKVIEEEMRAKELLFKDSQAKAKSRGIAAVKLQQELDKKRVQEENALKERRAEVLRKENEIAKEVAQRFREKQEIIEEQKREEAELNYIRPGGTVFYGKIDYSKTHFHNPVILKHDLEGRTAIEIAIDEQEQALLRFQSLEDLKTINQKKASERGEKALLEVAVEKQLAELSKDLEKIRKADGSSKIQRGIKENVVQNRCLVKTAQDKVKKQEKMEKMFEEIAFAPLDKEVRSEKPERNHVEEDKKILDIPQPLNEKFKGEGEKEVEKNDRFQQKYLPKKKKEKEEESESGSEDDLELSESEESSEVDVLQAKYSQKKAKKAKKGKRVKKTSKKMNESLQKKKETGKKFKEHSPVAEDSQEDEDFDMEDDQKFKAVLENEYEKHLKIKKELLDLKSYQNPKKPVEKRQIADPPSLSSSKIAPKSPHFQNLKEDDSFEKTSAFPAEKSSNDPLLYPSKPEKSSFPVKKSLVMTKTVKIQEESSSESEEAEVSDIKSRDFLEEMKIKYGIVPKPSEPAKDSSEKPREKIATSDPIFSERTLKLMQEIEEKYSLDKFKSSESQDDYRFDLPRLVPESKPAQNFKQPLSEEPVFGNYLKKTDLPPKSRAEIEQSDSETPSPSFDRSGGSKPGFRSQSPDRSSDSSNQEESKSNEDLYEFSQDSPKSQGNQFDIQKYSESAEDPDESKSSENRFSFNDKFFNEIKNKYGFSNPKSEKKEFNYQFDFERKLELSEENSINESSRVQEERSNDSSASKGKSYSESNGAEEKSHNESSGVRESSGVAMDFSEGQGKSLAEIFKERKGITAERLNQREAGLNKGSHKEKSKEELMEIRKELMKSKVNKSKEAEPEIEVKSSSNPLLERLGKGEKTKITKKEMHELTKKNYDLLPEVKKKKEEERKKQELKERIQKSKEFEKKRQENRGKNL